MVLPQQDRKLHRKNKVASRIDFKNSNWSDILGAAPWREQFENNFIVYNSNGNKTTKRQTRFYKR